MDCDKKCSLCKYEDCICESEDYSDINDIDRSLDFEISKQRAIEKGTYSVWKYNHSEKGKENLKKYRQSEKGKAMERKKTQKRIASGKNSEYCRNYYYRKKAKIKAMGKNYDNQETKEF